MIRPVLVAVIVATILSTSIGFALGRLSDPAPARATPRAQESSTAGTLRQIRRSTRNTERDIYRIRLALGDGDGGIWRFVAEINRSLGPGGEVTQTIRNACRAISSTPTSC